MSGAMTIEPTMTIPWVLQRRLARDPHVPLFERKASLGSGFVPVTTTTFVEEVNSLARGLIALGVEPEDRVAIFSPTSYEWTLLDFAIWSVAAVPVPIYETSSADQVEWIVSDSGVRLVFVETRAMAGLVRPLVDHLDHLEEVLTLDEDGKITELMVMTRPLKASQALAARMAERFEEIKAAAGRP